MKVLSYSCVVRTRLVLMPYDRLVMCSVLRNLFAVGQSCRLVMSRGQRRCQGAIGETRKEQRSELPVEHIINGHVLLVFNREHPNAAQCAYFVQG